MTGAAVVDPEGPMLDVDVLDVAGVVLTGVITILVPGLVPLGGMVDVIGAVILPVPV